MVMPGWRYLYGDKAMIKKGVRRAAGRAKERDEEARLGRKAGARDITRRGDTHAEAPQNLGGIFSKRRVTSGPRPLVYRTSQIYNALIKFLSARLSRLIRAARPARAASSCFMTARELHDRDPCRDNEANIRGARLASRWGSSFTTQPGISDFSRTVVLRRERRYR